MNFPTIYLASASPRRRELLTQIGVDFSVISVDVDESHFENESPIKYVQRVAVAKSRAGWENLGKQEKRPVLGADTSVILGQDILGKPRNEDDARKMLKGLSGTNHQVLTAIAIVFEQQVLSDIQTSEVTFAHMDDADIDWYISTKEGVDKAGGYAVQGLAALFIQQIKGSYSGIMGLPLRETGVLLAQLSRQNA